MRNLDQIFCSVECKVFASRFTTLLRHEIVILRTICVCVHSVRKGAAGWISLRNCCHSCTVIRKVCRAYHCRVQALSWIKRTGVSTCAVGPTDRHLYPTDRIIKPVASLSSYFLSLVKNPDKGQSSLCWLHFKSRFQIFFMNFQDIHYSDKLNWGFLGLTVVCSRCISV